MQAAIHEPGKLGELLNVCVPESWSIIAGLPVEWYGLLIHKADKTLIGYIGFNYPPKEGVTEYGDYLVPEYRNCGYATEIEKALFQWAFQEAGIKAIRAIVRENNSAAIRVQEKLGMTRIGYFSAPAGPFVFEQWSRWEVCKQAWYNVQEHKG
jgi:RimJ/RimL family protein N-acetyltransferase